MFSICGHIDIIDLGSLGIFALLESILIFVPVLDL